MVSNFLLNDGEVEGLISTISTSVKDYTANVDALEALLKDMTTSDAWQDEKIKTAFVATCTGYIKIYRSYIAGLEGYVKCLKIKKENLIDNETKFS